MTKSTTRSKKTSPAGKSKTAAVKSPSVKTRSKSTAKAHPKSVVQNKSRNRTATENTVKVRTVVSPFDSLATKTTASPLSCERFLDENDERVLVSSELTNLVDDVPDSFIDESIAQEIFGVNRSPIVGVIDRPETDDVDRSGFDSIFNETRFEPISSKSGIIDKITAGITKVVSNFSETDSDDPAGIFDRKILAKIACYAAQEIEGVIPNKSSVVNGVINAIRRSINGIRVEVGKTEAAVDMAITVKYGTDIPDVISRLRETVASRINAMTGLKVVEVNIRISDIAQP